MLYILYCSSYIVLSDYHPEPVLLQMRKLGPHEVPTPRNQAVSWQRSGPEGGRRCSRCFVLLQERRGGVGVPGGSLLFCRKWLGGKLLHKAEFGVSSPQPALRSQPLDSLREASTAAPSLGPSWASKCAPGTEGEQAGGPPCESVLSSRPVACYLPSSGDTAPLCTLRTPRLMKGTNGN